MIDLTKASKYSNPVTKVDWSAGMDHDAMMQAFWQRMLFRNWFRVQVRHANAHRGTTMKTSDIRKALEQAITAMEQAVTAGDFEAWRKHKNIAKDLNRLTKGILSEHERATHNYENLIDKLS